MADIRDLIYFDFERAASLLSQIEGGLLQETQAETETGKDERNIRKYDLKLFKPEFGGVSAEKQSVMTTRVLHHDLLGRLEAAIQESNAMVDVNNEFTDSSTDVETVHAALARAAYVRAEGWAIIQDFEKLKGIASRHNDFVDFIGRCTIENLKKSPEYVTLAKQLDEAVTQARTITDRNKRTVAEKKITKQKAMLRDVIEQHTGLGGVDEWLLEGIGFVIDTFMPGRILLTTHPLESVPSFRVLANLKRTCFVDDDLDSIVYAYGNRPNVKLTTLGLITSLPDATDSRFDPTSTSSEGEGSEHAKVEQGFAGMFRSFDEYYRFFSFSRYPSVTVHPIAVYRHVHVADRSDG